MAAAARNHSILPCNFPLSSSLRTQPSNITPFSPFIHPFFTIMRLSAKSSKNSAFENPNSTVADQVLTDIQNSGIISCLRAQSAEVAIEAARAALSGGISVLEVVMSTPDIFEVLKCLVQEYPSSSIGEIIDDVVKGQALYIPGVMTPTEILFAYNAGAKIVKVYPVSALGGIQYIAALRKPFPHIPIVASQGITIDSVGNYIAEGASAVILSDAIFERKAMNQQDFVRIKQLARFAAHQGNEAVARRRR